MYGLSGIEVSAGVGVAVGFGGGVSADFGISGCPQAAASKPAAMTGTISRFMMMSP